MWSPRAFDRISNSRARAGLAVDRGIIVDNNLPGHRPGIYAIGECAEHRGVCYGLVEPAYEQASVLAARLTGEESSTPGACSPPISRYPGSSVFCRRFHRRLWNRGIVFSRDLGLGIYKKLVILKGRLIGAVYSGDITDGLWYLDLIRSRQLDRSDA